MITAFGNQDNIVIDLLRNRGYQVRKKRHMKLSSVFIHVHLPVLIFFQVVNLDLIFFKQYSA